MTVCGHLTLASREGTKSASSLPFHLIRNISSPDESVAPIILSGFNPLPNPPGDRLERRTGERDLDRPPPIMNHMFHILVWFDETIIRISVYTEKIILVSYLFV